MIASSVCETNYATLSAAGSQLGVCHSPVMMLDGNTGGQKGNVLFSPSKPRLRPPIPAIISFFFFNPALFSFQLVEERCLLNEKPRKCLVVEWFVSRTLVSKYLRRKSCARLLHPSQLWWKASGWGELRRTQCAWEWRNRRLWADRMRTHDHWVTASACYLCVLSNEVGESNLAALPESDLENTWAQRIH